MTFWIILVFALVLSIISLKYRNLFFSFAGALGWFGLWAYNNSNPPINVTRGSFVHEVLMYGSLIMAIGVMFMYYRNRQRGYTGYETTKKEETEIASRRPARGLMDISTAEYKQLIHSKMHRRR